MSCRLCKKTDHNARRCPKNPEAGNKVNAHIKRAKTRKRKDTESASTSVVANDQAGNRSTRAKRTTTERVTFFATQPTQSTTARQPRQRSTRPNRLAHLMFGDNY